MHATRSKRAHDDTVCSGWLNTRRTTAGRPEQVASAFSMASTRAMICFSPDDTRTDSVEARSKTSGKKKEGRDFSDVECRVKEELWQELNFFASFNHESTCSVVMYSRSMHRVIRCVVLIII